ncbi:DUF4919 domain-containing protein [Mangrovibacterium lignilyticum]|uniref:DUF4919 domain-containing protein n=1 Tax=Mangrovibacterium lignilyticum TaxID=2668052 RepID=UPI0013D7203E|nr:DUF4919 domain-containing protein [Mangrovibacterium lignilyticum]
MKNASLTICCCLLLSLTISAQSTDVERPDYRKIRKEIEQKKSSFYYPYLMQRFLVADSTLTLQEKRHLYYGYQFQAGYAPYASPKYIDHILVILKKETQSINDIDRIIQLSDSILVKNPFSMQALNYQLYALRLQKDENQVQLRTTQIQIILDALLSSGDGTTKKDAFYVIDPSHEYAIIDAVGLQFRGAQYLVDHYDFLELKENELGLKGLFFDVSPSLNHLNKIFP